MNDSPRYSAWFEVTLLACGPHKLDVIKLRAYSWGSGKQNNW